jgi:hypothetical protein
MPTLTRTYRWERFEPHLGNNLELPPKQRFYLEVASGLTKAQLEAFGVEHRKAFGASAEATVDPMTAELSKHVRMGSEPLIVDGVQVATLRDYVALCFSSPGLFNYMELAEAVVEFNSVSGTFSHFSAWRSGGTSGTRAQSAERESATTEGR